MSTKVLPSGRDCWFYPPSVGTLTDMSAAKDRPRTWFRRLAYGLRTFAVVVAGLLVMAITIKYVDKYVVSQPGFYYVFWSMVLAAVAFEGINEERTKKATRRVAALTEVSAAIGSLRACSTSPETDLSRTARSRIDLYEAIELAHARGVPLKTMSDEILTSLEGLNQMDAAIRVQMDAATEARSRGLTIRLGVLLAIATVLAAIFLHKMGLT